MDVSAQPDVVQNGHPAEKFYLLEGSGNAHLSPLVGAEAGNQFPIEVNAPLLGTVEPIDTVHHNGFSGTVRADQGEDLPPFDLKTDVREGGDTAKGYMDMLHLQQWRVSRCFVISGHVNFLKLFGQ